MYPHNKIPRSALVLGWAGVIPFALLAGFIVADLQLSAIDPNAAFIRYAAIILSFMGGVHWGMAINDELPNGSAVPSQTMRLVFSVIPALVGWLTTFFAFGVAVVLLIGAFVLLFVFDAWANTRQWTPTWYLRLRGQLTLAVVAMLVLASSHG